MILILPSLFWGYKQFMSFWKMSRLATKTKPEIGNVRCYSFDSGSMYDSLPAIGLPLITPIALQIREV